MLTFRGAGPRRAGRTSYIEGIGRLKHGVTFDQARAELPMLADRLARRVPGHECGDRRQRVPDARQHVAAVPGDAPEPGRRQLVPAPPHLRQPRESAAGARGGARARDGGARGARRGQRATRAAADHRKASCSLCSAAGSDVLIAALAVPLFSSAGPGDVARGRTASARHARARGRGDLHRAHRDRLRSAPRVPRGGRTGFDALREGTRAGGGPRQRVRTVLVAVEVAVSVMLLICVRAPDSRRVARAGGRSRIPRGERADTADRAAAGRSTTIPCAARSSTIACSVKCARCQASRARRTSAVCPGGDGPGHRRRGSRTRSAPRTHATV